MERDLFATRTSLIVRDEVVNLHRELVSAGDVSEPHHLTGRFKHLKGFVVSAAYSGDFLNEFLVRPFLLVGACCTSVTMQKIVDPLTVLSSTRRAANGNFIVYSSKCFLREKYFDFFTKVVFAALLKLLLR